ncbi:MAG: hypothetical protein QOJ52_2535, partial [Acidimicrobiaceae bacterium]|nr:hypothetical protein [Acidimicrobiaceae bacterium]
FVERLAVLTVEPVQQIPTSRVSQRSEHGIHVAMIGN